MSLSVDGGMCATNMWLDEVIYELWKVDKVRQEIIYVVTFVPIIFDIATAFY